MLLFEFTLCELHCCLRPKVVEVVLVRFFVLCNSIGSHELFLFKCIFLYIIYLFYQYLSFYLSIILSITLSFYLSIILSTTLSFYLLLYHSIYYSIILSIYHSFYHSISLPYYLSIYLFTYPSITIYLSIYHYLPIYISIYQSIYHSILYRLRPRSRYLTTNSLLTNCASTFQTTATDLTGATIKAKTTTYPRPPRTASTGSTSPRHRRRPTNWPPQRPVQPPKIRKLRQQGPILSTQFGRNSTAVKNTAIFDAIF